MATRPDFGRLQPMSQELEAELMRERLRLAQERPLVWQGDLSSDCRASWAGFFLRARARESNRWYWVVYDHWSDDSVVAHSVGDLEIQPTTGAEAREQAEMATKALLPGLST